MKTFGRISWLVAGYVLLALAPGAAPRTARATVTLGQTSPHCVSDITNITATWKARDLHLNRRNPAASRGTLTASAVFDYTGGVQEGETPKDSVNTLFATFIMKVLVVLEGNQETSTFITLNDDEGSSFPMTGIQQLSGLQGHTFSFTGAELMSLIIQRASENNPDLISIPGNQFKTVLQVGYAEDSTCRKVDAAADCAWDGVLLGTYLLLKRGNGDGTDTNPDPGFTEVH